MCECSAVALCAIGVALSPAACSPSPRPAAPAVLSSPVLTTESWTFSGIPGRMYRTRSYRLFTTATDPIFVEQLPFFLESALDHYTTGLGPLPRPQLKLDTFLMGDRDQWSRLTTQVMGDQASTYLKIERGGFASGGRALLWTIGRHDTLAIAAHEGWHQYTQRTFRDELPAWAEEGVAVYMEGFLPDPADPLRPIFLPWANPERFDQLSRSAAANALAPLDRLLSATPQDLIDQSTESTLTYYSQLWAFIHFLQEGEGGKHRERLIAMISDAAAGRLDQFTHAKLARAPHNGADTFRAYFGSGSDFDSIQSEFDVFTATITKPDTREKILRGSSPLEPRPG